MAPHPSDSSAARWRELNDLVPHPITVWRRLIAHLEEWQRVDPAEAQRACDNALYSVRTWRDQDRPFPQRDLDDYLALPESSVLVQLASSLSVSGQIGAAEIRRLVASPKVSRLRALEISAWSGPKSPGLSDEALALLADSPLLRNLKALSFRGARAELVSPEGVRAVVESRYLRNLRVLNLSGMQVQDTGARAIAESVSLRSLRVLHLAASHIGEAGARALANQEWTQLTDLDVSNNNIGAGGLRALITSSHLDQLRTFRFISERADASVQDLVQTLAAHFQLPEVDHIDLSRTRVTSADLGALTNSTRFGSVAALTLFRCGLGSNAVATLLSGDGLASLTRLNLGQNRIGTDGLQAVCETKALRRLQVLSLRDNKIKKPGASTWANAALPNLVEFDLRGNKLGDEGLRQLAESPLVFSELDVGRNEIGSAGVQALVDSGRLQHIRSLKLDGNEIGDAGVKALAESPQLSNVTYLIIHSNAFGAEGDRALALSPHLYPALRRKLLAKLPHEELRLAAVGRGVEHAETLDTGALIDAILSAQNSEDAAD